MSEVMLSTTVSAEQRVRVGDHIVRIEQFIHSLEGLNGLFYRVETRVPGLLLYDREDLAPNQDIGSVADSQMYRMVRRIRLIIKNTEED